ncbi:MAG: NADPH-adrenodoxin reductase [Vezdaea aestivalis]|nr:MAG: NADPH-adrenodoxin reductase [Vezdaea aestivalis]
MRKVPDVCVDMYESLPVPFGLVRYGVAPDHPENCQDTFGEVASSPHFCFIGSTSIGSDLPLSVLKPHYDGIVFAYGASQDRQLGIPGETTLKGIHSARAFVGWYNGLPEYADLQPDLTKGEDATVIGQGNVALDVARILLTPVDLLSKTDITQYALEALSKSRVKRVTIVGRRGPGQAAFTTKEARELMNLPGVAFEPIEQALLPPAQTIKALPRTTRRMMQVLQKGSESPGDSSGDSPDKSWELRFLLSPQTFGTTNDSTSIGQITFEKNRFSAGNDKLDPLAKIEPSDETETIPAQIAFKSIGYKAAPLEGFQDFGIPFDHRRGIIPHDSLGRVLREQDGANERLPGLYCAGWVKSGPNGVIAHTMEDAFLTAEAIAQDWEAGRKLLNGLPSNVRVSGWDGVKVTEQGRKLRATDWQHWQRIDEAERTYGRKLGKEREKLVRVADMLTV